MKYTAFGLAAAALSAVPLAAAHGFVSKLVIDGTTYKGNSPGGSTSDSAIRQISTIDPVKGATNKAVNCGPDAQPAALLADANPGSSIEITWSGGDNTLWPHNTGPLISYLASCGDTPCEQFDAINAKWFKIDQAGRKDNGDWFQQDFMSGGTYTLTLPDNLASGNYMMRHEIIALHLATSKGGAEFYPSCFQLAVGGSKTGTPSEDDLVSLPGAYSDNDPGIFDPNVFDTNVEYQFPGPAIAVLADNGSSSGSNSGSTSASSTKSASATGTKTRGSVDPTSTASSNDTGAASPSSSSGKCSLKKKNSLKKRSKINYPHHISRVMRSLYHHS